MKKEKKTTQKKPGMFASLVGTKFLKEHGEEIVNSGKRLMTPKYARDNAKNETFEEAVSRLDVTDYDIAQIKKNYTINFWVSFGAFVFCFIGLLYSLFITKSLIVGCSFISISLMVLANSFRFSFRVFQINHKKLCGAKEWWNHPNEWFPKY